MRKELDELNKMTKDELIDYINEIEKYYKEEIENTKSYLGDEISELETEIEDLTDELNGYTNIDFDLNEERFVWRLKLCGLYTQELEDFLEEFKKYYN